MSKTVNISLEEHQCIEDSSETDRNIVQVQVGSHGVWHSSPDWIVDLSLSREAMIGLATELLRAAQQSPDAMAFVEMLPSEAECAVERFGVYMHPKSCRLNLRQQDFGVLETLIR